MKKITILLIILFTHFLLLAQENIINVPSNFAKIQDAIDSSIDGDTILVAPGTYLENINFNGKNIVVTSQFLFEKDKSFISSTIIDGSTPNSSDTASVVLFVNGEDSSAVLQGFTITGGKGTRTYNTAERIDFRTGGGILIDHASPTIIYNNITHNESINTSGVTGAGGGGIRAGQSKAAINNNYITYNKGGYAGGLMLAFCEGMKIRNNVIAYNEAFGAFNGGGGIYIDWRNVPLINCTIVYNKSGIDGGGIIVTGTPNTIKNCIIYGNTASSHSQGVQIFNRFNGNAKVSFSNVQGETSGSGNIDLEPLFSDTSSFNLSENSPCIDAGNPHLNYFDIEDPENLGSPLFPALGGLKNDMGAFGGNSYMLIDSVNIISNNTINKNTFSPGTDTVIFSSKIFSPKNQQVDVKAIIESYDGSISDTIQMVDDGSLGDSLAGDGLYAGIWGTNDTENHYRINISTFLTEYNQLVIWKNALLFTTKGPIKFESFEITSNDTIPNPGDRVKFKINLKNYGLTDTIYNVDLQIVIPEGSCVRNTTTGKPKFGDIAPGEIIGNTNRSYALSFADTCSPDHNHEFELLIMSNNVVFWSDTFSMDLITGIDETNLTTPTEFKLYQNYPNPFNPITTIKYNIPILRNTKNVFGNVVLKVYDILGKEVSILINEPKSAGSYEVQFDATNLSSGIYYYQLRVGSFAETKKLLMMK